MILKVKVALKSSELLTVSGLFVFFPVSNINVRQPAVTLATIYKTILGWICIFAQKSVLC
jgi:hypothetical protein